MTDHTPDPMTDPLAGTRWQSEITGASVDVPADGDAEQVLVSVTVGDRSALSLRFRSYLRDNYTYIGRCPHWQITEVDADGLIADGPNQGRIPVTSGIDVEPGEFGWRVYNPDGVGNTCIAADTLDRWTGRTASPAEEAARILARDTDLPADVRALLQRIAGEA